VLAELAAKAPGAREPELGTKFASAEQPIGVGRRLGAPIERFCELPGKKWLQFRLPFNWRRSLLGAQFWWRVRPIRSGRRVHWLAQCSNGGNKNKSPGRKIGPPTEWPSGQLTFGAANSNRLAAIGRLGNELGKESGSLLTRKALF